VADRKSDMVISGDVNIYPAEIEAVLMTLPREDSGKILKRLFPSLTGRSSAVESRFFYDQYRPGHCRPAASFASHLAFCSRR